MTRTVQVGSVVRERELTSRVLCSLSSTAELKAAWDSDWPPGDVLDGVWLEHVHEELNRRGEGKHCAV